jgi:hypothetical protein
MGIIGINDGRHPFPHQSIGSRINPTSEESGTCFKQTRLCTLKPSKNTKFY